MAKTQNSGKKLRVTLIKSPYGTGKNHMACVRGLGLRRQRHSVELPDTPAIRGMINKIAYLVKCVGETE
jgi:large subunit ribosomal protein L30